MHTIKKINITKHFLCYKENKKNRSVGWNEPWNVFLSFCLCGLLLLNLYWTLHLSESCTRNLWFHTSSLTPLTRSSLARFRSRNRLLRRFASPRRPQVSFRLRNRSGDFYKDGSFRVCIAITEVESRIPSARKRVCRACTWQLILCWRVEQNCRWSGTIDHHERRRQCNVQFQLW